MKKILAALLLSSLLALTLVSCGNAAEDPAAGSGTASRTETSSEEGGLINVGPGEDDGEEWGPLIGVN